MKLIKKFKKESISTLPSLVSCINGALEKNEFPDSFKLPNIVPAEKKKDTTDRINRSPISILPLMSTILEKLMYEHVDLKNHLNELLWGFCNAHSAQNVF